MAEEENAETPEQKAEETEPSAEAPSPRRPCAEDAATEAEEAEEQPQPAASPTAPGREAEEVSGSGSSEVPGSDSEEVRGLIPRSPGRGRGRRGRRAGGSAGGEHGDQDGSSTCPRRRPRADRGRARAPSSAPRRERGCEAEAEERASREAELDTEGAEEDAARQSPGADRERRALHGDRQAQELDRPGHPRPGERQDRDQRRTLEEYFPRPLHQTMACQPLATAGYEGNVDVAGARPRRRDRGQAGAVRHGIARALTEIDPELRGELKRRGLPDSRRAGQGAPQGRAEEGPQAAAVLEALSSDVARRDFSAPTASAARPGPRSPPSWRCRWAAPRRPRARAERPQVLIVRDTRESGPMLEAALAAGIADGGRRRPDGRGPADPGGGDPRPPSRPRPGGRRLRLPQPLRRQRDQVLRRRWCKLDDETEARIEELLDGAPPVPARFGRVRELNGGLGRLPASPRGGLPARPLRDEGDARLRQRRHLPRRSGDLRAARGRGRDDGGRARRAQHQRGLRLHPPEAARARRSRAPRRRSASPSTATATGCLRWTVQGPPTTATS